MLLLTLEGDYSTTSPSWQMGRLARRFRQWVAYELSKLNFDGPDLPELPDWSLSEAVQQILFWSLVTLLTLWLAFLLYRALEQPVRDWLERTQGWTRLGDRTPSPEKEHSAQYWWQQAQTYAKQGNYKEACKALYRATLQQLHDTQVLPHDASRTDGEYLRSLKQTTDVHSVPRPYQLLIGTHERLVFGITDASAGMFKRCRLAYEEVQKRAESQKREPKS